MHRGPGLRPRPRAADRARTGAPPDDRPADRARMGSAGAGLRAGARGDARLRGLRAGDHCRLAAGRPPPAPRRAQASGGGPRRPDRRRPPKARSDIPTVPNDRSQNMSSTDALVFDALRTPRGKGKVNGSLHSTKPVDLVVGLMHEMLSRNVKLDPNRIDDVVLGCVSPVGDQGADIAKTAAIKASLPDTVAGVQLNRFCASGLEAVNIAAQKVASGWEDLVFAGGVESMSRVPMGSDGGAWAMDPETNYDTSFVPQGISDDLIATVEEFSREDVDAYAARSQELAAKAQEEGRFAKSVVPVLDINDQVVLDHDEFIRKGTTVETLGKLKPSFAVMGEMGGFDAVALQKYHWIERIDHVHTPGNSSGIVDGASLLAIGNEQIAKDLDLTPRARILATAVSG